MNWIDETKPADNAHWELALLDARDGVRVGRWPDSSCTVSCHSILHFSAEDVEQAKHDGPILLLAHLRALADRLEESLKQEATP